MVVKQTDCMPQPSVMWWYLTGFSSHTCPYISSESSFYVANVYYSLHFLECLFIFHLLKLHKRGPGGQFVEAAGCGLSSTRPGLMSVMSVLKRLFVKTTACCSDFVVLIKSIMFLFFCLFVFWNETYNRVCLLAQFTWKLNTCFVLTPSTASAC